MCAQHLHELVCASADFMPMHDPKLFIYSFRFFPQALKQFPDQSQLNIFLDKLNQEVADEIMATGFAFIMTSKVKGHIVIRLSICSHRTTFQDIELVFERLQAIGRRIYQEDLSANPLIADH